MGGYELEPMTYGLWANRKTLSQKGELNIPLQEEKANTKFASSQQGLITPQKNRKWGPYPPEINHHSTTTKTTQKNTHNNNHDYRPTMMGRQTAEKRKKDLKGRRPKNERRLDSWKGNVIWCGWERRLTTNWRGGRPGEC